MKPGRLPDGDGGWQAPHIDLSVFARGMLDRVVTRCYFADEAAANAADPVLARCPPTARADARRRGRAPTATGSTSVLQGERRDMFFSV